MGALDDAKALASVWETVGADDFCRAQVCGYLSVIAVREFEIQIRNLLVSFATRCHGNFGHYVARDFEKLNGRIMIDDLGDKLNRFDATAHQKFVRLHQQATARSLATHKLDAVNGYNSVILNRHEFVHKGNLTLSLDEARRYIELSPSVIACVEQALA